MMSVEDIIHRVKEDLLYIQTKYPEEHLSPTEWLALVGEEVGEMFMSINDKEIDNFINECCQTCATIITAAVDIINNREYTSVKDYSPGTVIKTAGGYIITSDSNGWVMYSPHHKGVLRFSTTDKENATVFKSEDEANSVAKEYLNFAYGIKDSGNNLYSVMHCGRSYVVLAKDSISAIKKIKKLKDSPKFSVVKISSDGSKSYVLKSGNSLGWTKESYEATRFNTQTEAENIADKIRANLKSNERVRAYVSDSILEE